MNFIARRHNLFFQHEINFFQAGLHFLERKDAFIHDIHAERGQDRMPLAIRDAEIELRVFTGQVGRLARADGDLQFISRFHVENFGIADDVR